MKQLCAQDILVKFNCKFQYCWLSKLSKFNLNNLTEYYVFFFFRNSQIETQPPKYKYTKKKIRKMYKTRNKYYRKTS